jgi:sugar diacid utilization regulator
LTIPFGLPGLDLHAGEHLCAFHRGAATRDDILTAYLRAGLKAGHKCICAIDNTDPETLRAALGEDLAGDRETGDLPLEIYRSQDVYLAGGEFSIAANMAFWDQAIGAAIGRGFPAARAVGEMPWSAPQMPGAEGLARYEAELNRFMPRYPQVILCLYDLEASSGEVVIDMLKTHPRLLVRGIVWDNPYYLAPAEFLAARHSGAPGPGAVRDRQSSLQGLQLLSILMIDSRDERQILHLALSSVPSFGHSRPEGAALAGGQWLAAAGTATRPLPAGLARQLTKAGELGGPVAIDGRGWGWAFPLGGLDDQLGFLVVSAASHAPAGERFLLQVLAHQAGVALANARLHESQRLATAELTAANATLAETIRALRSSTAIHDRLTRVATAGEGEDGIARALHELTGYPVAVEDRWGNLRAWAGPERPDPYPKDPPARREELVRRLSREGRPLREGDRLVTLAHPAADVIGVLALADPGRTAGTQEQVALEHGATVLAMELARLHSIAETELRVRRDLVEELLAGADDAGALARARALGYDLQRPHRVVVISGQAHPSDQDVFLHAVRRAARAAGVGTLMTARGGAVVLLAEDAADWDRLHDAVHTELGGGCRIGVGGQCARPRDFPRSWRQARFALKMQDEPGRSDQVIVFDQLGVYRVFSDLTDPVEVEGFVREWLAGLLDYDARKNGVLVQTLSAYLECGASLEATSKALVVHRSTLKYRLQRIREISGHDLSDADARFNLQLATRALRTLRALHHQGTREPGPRDSPGGHVPPGR